jgi:hypothetical protein
MVAVAIVLFNLSGTKFDLNRPNRKGNSKANGPERVIPKAHLLKEINGPCLNGEDHQEKRGQNDENFTHERRVLSQTGPLVQHIEHKFSPTKPFYQDARWRATGCSAS